MPFASEAQKRMMYAVHPKLAAEMEAKTPKGAKLPEHVKKKGDPPGEIDDKIEEMAEKLDSKLVKPAEEMAEGEEMDAKTEARIGRLLDRFGAPEEWTGSIKEMLGPDNMAMCKAMFEKMSPDEQAAFREKWEMREHEGKKMPMAAKAAEPPMNPKEM